MAALGLLVSLIVATTARADDKGSQEAAWSPVADAMLSKFAGSVSPDNVWNEYPRPGLVRDDWTNLNGLWDYAITAKAAEQPTEWDGQILVPFAVEAPLSGVGRRLAPKQALWYRTTIEQPDHAGPVRLHFEAVDYECRVWLDGRPLGTHIGGNLPFSFLITEPISETSELVVQVFDATDTAGAYQLRGKQQIDNKGIWYTPVSGIWQTVWMEPVPAAHIVDLKIDGTAEGVVTLSATIEGDADQLRVTALDDGAAVATATGSASGLSLTIPNAKLWSPDSPNLYDLRIELLKGGQTVDAVTSYVGLRTLGKRRDDNGDLRLTINGEDIFHWGPLDQGWWPGGLLTPPSDEAIRFEIDYLKGAGFNMIRKHIKVEPRRYYAYCDRLGMLVWQDQVSGGRKDTGEWPAWQRLSKTHQHTKRKTAWQPGQPLDADWPDAAHEQFMAELKGMVDQLGSHPSIAVWTPFNERWGQHRTEEVGRWIAAYDPSRTVNVASGGNFFPVGDIADEHDYPHPTFAVDDSRFDDFVKVVGEFGGHGWPVPGHLWDRKKRNWGYGGLPQTKQEYLERFRQSLDRLGKLKRAGVAAGVYTQTTDVEGEINGLMTYDREVIKISAPELKQMATDAGLIEP